MSIRTQFCGEKTRLKINRPDRALFPTSDRLMHLLPRPCKPVLRLAGKLSTFRTHPWMQSFAPFFFRSEKYVAT